MKKARILYLSYDGMTDPLGQSQVIPYLAGLTDKGYGFTIISFEKPENYHRLQDQIRGQLAERQIHWIPLTYHKKPPIFSTLCDLWLLKRKVIQLHRKEPYDILHCRSYLTALTGLWMKQHYGVKLIFDMRGFWADERVEGGIWNLKNPVFRLIYWYFKKKEKQLLENADYTISLTQNARKEIHSWQHIRNNPIPIQVIPCCADLSLFDRRKVNPIQVDQLRERLGLEDTDFVLLYLGSVGTWYMLEEMLDLFKVLLRYRARSRFLILTRDNAASITGMAAKKGIQKDQLIITPAERTALPDYMALAHLSVFFIKPVFSKRASSPTKQGELMGMGIPIICNDKVGDTGEIIRKTGAGAVIADFTEQNYAAVCEQIDKLLALNAEKIRKGSEQYYSLSKGIDAYDEVYRSVLHG